MIGGLGVDGGQKSEARRMLILSIAGGRAGASRSASRSKHRKKMDAILCVCTYVHIYSLVKTVYT